MKSRLMRLAGATALAALTATAATPALAGGPGWGGGYGPGGYHGGHRGGHSSGWSAADRWIVGGAIGLITAGLLLSANAEPSYSYAPTVQMGSNGYAYMSPGYSVAPVYAPPPVYVQPPAYAPAPAYAAPVYEPAASYAADPTDPASVNLAPAPVAQTTAATGHVNCARYAMDQSGFDPAGASQWTTQVMVDSYNRALQTCRDQRWGS